MKQFEYTSMQSVSPATPESICDTFNKMGSDGWEVVGWNYGSVFFKREITDEMQIERAKKAQQALWMQYRSHLHEEHDVQVYIDTDIVGTHRSKFPSCPFGLRWERS